MPRPAEEAISCSEDLALPARISCKSNCFPRELETSALPVSKLFLMSATFGPGPTAQTTSSSSSRPLIRERRMGEVKIGRHATCCCRPALISGAPSHSLLGPTVASRRKGLKFAAARARNQPAKQQPRPVWPAGRAGGEQWSGVDFIARERLNLSPLLVSSSRERARQRCTRFHIGLTS